MYAIIIEISFFEALFKVHYTKGFRLTYPIPLPTSVAGIFGALIGIERKEIAEKFKDFLFGGKLIHYESFVRENITYIQFKKSKIVKGVAKTQIINNPTYEIAMAGEYKKIETIYDKIKKEIAYLPYGGQNDFFLKDIKIKAIKQVKESNIIENYSPTSWIERIEMGKSSEIFVLPVNVNKNYLKDNLFSFIYKGKFILNKSIPTVNNIGLYPLEYFEYMSL